MFGDNPIRQPLKGDGNALEVHSIFATLQGEGPLAGTPAVFIRLGGCNLACDFCDTEFENFAARPLTEITREADHLSRNAAGERVCGLIVITGGEPLRQPVGPLCELLLSEGFEVQIETNGTLFRPLDARVKIVCSPKAANGNYHPLREDLLSRLDAIKFIISTRTPYHQVVELGQTAHGIPVYVQPMDACDAALNAANLALAQRLAQQHGYRLSLQLHKILGIP